MRRILIALAVSAVTLLPAAAHAQICTPFTDVPASNIFCGNIQWMLNRGITSGCGTNLYCPNDVMPRDQMAAFMNRLADRVTFQQGGNAFGAPAELGTTDNQVLEVIVNNSRVMRYEPHPQSPNVIGGHPTNNVTPGQAGATIDGGGGTGFPNRVNGLNGTVAGGLGNTAGFVSSVGGGSGNTAGGNYSTVSGGFQNFASGHLSFAAGSYANANGSDCAVFSLWGSSPGMQCFGGSSQFMIGALHGLSVDYHSQRPDGGGTRFVYVGNNFFPFTITTWNGASLGDNGVWNSVSDAEKKHAFAEVDKHALLEKLAALPIHSWSYKVETDDVRHIGPTSQDFKAAFGLGSDDKTIGMIDGDGVALAAIQGLNAKLEATLAERDARIAALAQELAQERSAREAQTHEIAELRQAFGALLAATKDADRIAPRSPEVASLAADSGPTRAPARRRSRD